eukprot:8085258-Pyramimonas_sp.AAC.1
MPTQSARVGLQPKQCAVSAHSTRDVYQNVNARLHQIEPLAMNVLEVGVASGSHASSGPGRGSRGGKRRLRRRPTLGIRRAGRRAGRREGRR